MPSLSVVHTVPSSQERGAGAFFTAKSKRTIEQPIHKPLETHRHFAQGAAQRTVTRSIIELETTVFPMAVSLLQVGRCWNRYQMATDR